MGILIFNSPNTETRKTAHVCNVDAIRKITLRESIVNVSEGEESTVSLILRITIQEDTGLSTYILDSVESSNNESELAAVKEKASQIASLLAGRVDCVDLDNSGILPEDKKGV